MRLLGVILLGLSATAYAEQYKSEVRELDSVPAEPSQPDTSAAQADPYVKALLLRDQAAQAIRQKDYKTAEKRLAEALATGALSGPAAAQMQRDLTLLRQGTAPAAPPKPVAPPKTKQQLLRELAAKPNAPPEVFIALGALLLQEKKPSEAIDWLKKGVDASKTPDPSWVQALAAALSQNGKDALPYLQQLAKLQPQNPQHWQRVIAALLGKGDKAGAAAWAELAARQNHLKKPEERLQWVSLLAGLGAPFEAASLLEGQIKAGSIPNTREQQKLLARLWSQAREPAASLRALEAAGEANADIWLEMAGLNTRLGRYDKAIEFLKKAQAAGKDNGALRLQLGTLYYQSADLTNAKAAFTTALRDASSSNAARQWLTFLEAPEAEAIAKKLPKPVQVAGLSSPRFGQKVLQIVLAVAKRPALDAIVAPLMAEIVRADNLAAQKASSVVASSANSPAGISMGLTPVGAEKGGNAKGDIPAWTGGGGQPAASDKPLFVINASNAKPYGAVLSEGHKALLAKFPAYQMPVYASQRTVRYPQAIYDASAANVGKAKLLGSDALTGARLGFPFIKPQSGVEVMWNHRVRYRGDAGQVTSAQAVVFADGSQQLLRQTERVYARYANLKDPIDLSQRNILLYYLTWFGQSRTDYDFTALVHETANSEKDQRAVWVIPPKVPKMFRIPPVGYDQPFPGSDGIQFIDMVDMYNGLFDRYVWKLVGKKELILPYNAFKASTAKYKDFLRKDFPNPAFLRYEKHRVWVIEATERGGKNHSFGKRVYYVDEDSWNVVLVENYDKKGSLWRFQEGHVLPLLPIQAANCAPVITFDLPTGRYFINRLLGEEPAPIYEAKMTEGEFTPASVKAKYLR